jgi:[acyl-carrier-protein] S-malonyltransferase
MGREFMTDEGARELFELADKTLGFELSKLCLEGPLDTLTLTQYAQPAILTVSCVAWNRTGTEVSAVAGHSLGEYSALVAAGVLRFEDAVALVHKRGCYMQEAVQPGVGKMIAVLGTPLADIEAALTPFAPDEVAVANVNAPGQIVLAGLQSKVDEFAAVITQSGAKVGPLNVSAPFHCSLMKGAAEKLAVDLDAVTFSDPRIPVYSNVTAMAISSGSDSRELLKRQVTSSVLWSESMTRAVSEQNVSAAVEFGHGNVLANLLKRIAPDVKRLQASSPDSCDSVRAALRA